MSIFKYKETIVSNQEAGPVTGMLAHDMPCVENIGPLAWKGHKIGAPMLRTIKEFLAYAYKKYGGEAQVRLFYHEEHGWGAHPFPQYASSTLSTKEIPKHEQCDVIRAKFPGYTEFGSVHSHCACSAFQSGIDLHDELKSAGFHITFGSMHGGPASQWTYHRRVSFRGIIYDEVVDADWFTEEAMKELLVGAVNEEGVFVPQPWKDQILPEPPPVAQTSSSGWSWEYDYDSYLHGRRGLGEWQGFDKTVYPKPPRKTAHERYAEQLNKKAKQEAFEFDFGLAARDISFRMPPKFWKSYAKLIAKSGLKAQCGVEILTFLFEALDQLELGEYSESSIDMATTPVDSPVLGSILRLVGNNWDK